MSNCYWREIDHTFLQADSKIWAVIPSLPTLGTPAPFCVPQFPLPFLHWLSLHPQPSSHLCRLEYWPTNTSCLKSLKGPLTENSPEFSNGCMSRLLESKLLCQAHGIKMQIPSVIPVHPCVARYMYPILDSQAAQQRAPSGHASGFHIHPLSGNLSEEKHRASLARWVGKKLK